MPDNWNEWVVVMPSIRSINVEFLAHVPEQVKVLVVDDSNGSIRANRPNMEIVAYDDYARVLGDQQDLIPRKTDTCRSFGFLLAWKQGYRYVITLDDDCQTHGQFMERHAVLGEKQTLRSVSSNPWYNTLDNLVMENGDGSPAKRFFARGVPYCHRHDPYPDPEFGEISGRVVCNMGMWLKVPDINGQDKLGHEVPTGVSTRAARLAVAPDTNFSLCIMNVGFLAEVIPAFYQLPMKLDICGQKLDRFGDIWSGYILKRLTDIRGDLITIGDPLVTHSKAGNTVREAQVEHYGHLLENYFYPAVDEAASQTASDSYARMYLEFSEHFQSVVGQSAMPAVYRQLLSEMADKMIRWARLFSDE